MGESERPLEEQLPRSVVASPGEVRAHPGDENVTWWRPSWQEAAGQVGWRWVLLMPAVLMVGLLIAAAICIPLRPVLLIIGAKMLLLSAAIAVSLAGWVMRRMARARKEPFCIHCGYNLTSLPDNYRCPECGRPYNWRVIEEYRRDPQWFIERWKKHHQLPSADMPFDAGPVVKRRSKDGTG